MTTDELLADFRRLAAVLAPEMPPYVALQPDAWPTPVYTVAYATRPHPTHVQRRWLIEQGMWQGYSPLITFVDKPLDSAESRGVFLHELGHCLPPPDPREDVEPSAKERHWQDQRFQLLTEDVPPTDAPPWIGHDWRFVRRAIHVYYRAVNQGRWRLSFRDLQVAGENYGLSRASEYHDALGDEPDRLRHLSWRRLERKRPPDVFLELFAADRAAWESRKTNQPQEVF